MLLEVFKINVFYACTRQPLAGARRKAASITYIYIYIFVFVFFLNIYLKLIFFPFLYFSLPVISFHSFLECSIHMNVLATCMSTPVYT